MKVIFWHRDSMSSQTRRKSQEAFEWRTFSLPSPPSLVSPLSSPLPLSPSSFPFLPPHHEENPKMEDASFQVSTLNFQLPTSTFRTIKRNPEPLEAPRKLQTSNFNPPMSYISRTPSSPCIPILPIPILSNFNHATHPAHEMALTLSGMAAIWRSKKSFSSMNWSSSVRSSKKCCRNLVSLSRLLIRMRCTSLDLCGLATKIYGRPRRCVRCLFCLLDWRQRMVLELHPTHPIHPTHPPPPSPVPGGMKWRGG